MTTQLWLVTLHDKDLAGEPDIGVAFHIGSEREATDLGAEMEQALAIFGRARCVSRIRSVDTGRHYRTGALIRTYCSHLDT